MSVSGIHNHNIHLCIDQLLGALQTVCGDAKSGSAEETALSVFCGQRILDLLLNIFDRNESLQVEILVNDGQLLFSCLARIRFASSRVIPSGAVISPSEVMDSLIFFE